jgi:uncharacterized protein (TIGR00251 family)
MLRAWHEGRKSDEPTTTQNEAAAGPQGEGTRVSVHRWVGADLELSIHAQPAARTTEVQGLHGDAIKIRISARAVDGAANDALLEFVASALQVPRSRCVLLSGRTSRHKRVRIEAPDRALAESVLSGWLQTSS